MTSVLVRLSAIALYGSLCAYSLYGPQEDSPPWMFGHPWLAIFTLHLVLGLIVGRWWALLLPLIPCLLAIPVSDWNCGDGLECIGEPMALTVFFGMFVVALPFVAMGVGTTKWIGSLLEQRDSDGQAQASSFGDQNSSRFASGS